MSVKIGNAVSDERGKASGGVAGDSTKKEVRIQDWYSTSWTYVFRAIDANVAEKLAATMEEICKNDNIGYDQGQRTTLYTQAVNVNFVISKITKKCETDCSAAVAVCINAAGIKISKDMYTGNEKALIENTKKFTTLSDSKYLTSSNYLKRGDILLKNGHTAIALEDGAKIEPTVEYYARYTGKSASIVDALSSLGVPSSFSARTKIAKANNITDYSGTAKQNTTLLNLLKEGKLKVMA